jgi:hypothetical protein
MTGALKREEAEMFLTGVRKTAMDIDDDASLWFCQIL